MVESGMGGNVAVEGLGAIVRRRREQAGLSLREAARRAGISLSYLIAIENGRNPTTGRAPQPSPRVLAAISRVLELDMETLLAASGAAGPPSSAHVLLYQMGQARRSPLEAARRLFGSAAEAWIDIVDPGHPDPPRPLADDRVWHVPGPLGAEPPRFDSERVLQALSGELEQAPRSFRSSRVGIVFGANSSALRSAANPDSMLEAESTWETDVALRFHAALGHAPVANVCVYREDDIRELAPRLD
ncbi:MAG: Helix-turn-helix domain, partial [bacterium]